MKSTLHNLIVAASLFSILTGCEGSEKLKAAWLEFDWPEADSLFQRDNYWMGGDGAYSVDLGDDRILWLFGDSWIDPTGRGVRRGASMVSNTIGIQQGYDPTEATVHYYWQVESDGSPGAFFPDSGEVRFWPGHGIRLGDRLVLFLMVVMPTTTGLGFEVGDWTAVLVRNPDEDPSEWEIERLDTPRNNAQIIIGSGSVLKDGGYIYAYSAQEPTAAHDVYLVRWRDDDVRNGQLNDMEWWAGDEVGWILNVSEESRGQPVFHDGQTEFSVHHDSIREEYVEIQTVGFGPAVVVRRTAPKMTGPWSEVDTVFVPAQNQFPHIMIYQGKAHPYLTGAELLITYSTNSFEFDDHLTEEWLYYPRFARLSGPIPN